jgi:hypothetical protein
LLAFLGCLERKLVQAQDETSTLFYTNAFEHTMMDVPVSPHNWEIFAGF